ncbi:SDR family NAD(P)-dependent oxidoreductase [Edaphobacter sp. HDX4]|uniref:SDR family NAD(P)-dependent oxidoreductase n=1 Tax=Edaphobacter sp. HDX4 TaxID=2794064 RepID=UPI002FE60666
MQIHCQGKTVLVVGGTGGLGKSVTLTFLAEGAKVIVTYRNRQELSELQARAGAKAALLEGMEADALEPSSVAALVQAIITRHGSLDAVVNTVGAYVGGLKVWEVEAEVFERMLDLNLRTGFVLAQATIPVMLKQGSGAFINIASKAAIEHAAGASAYAASKAAAVALMDSLAEDVRGTGIRVNTVLPSIIDTAANREAMSSADFSKWPKPEDIARVILFLASDEAKVVHGASVPVYGNG